MTPVVLFASQASDAYSQVVPIGDFRLMNGAIPITVSGDFDGVAHLYGAIATQDEVNDSSANFEKIEGADFTGPIATALFSPFTHIKGSLASNTTGSLSMRVLI